MSTPSTEETAQSWPEYLAQKKTLTRPQLLIVALHLRPELLTAFKTKKAIKSAIDQGIADKSIAYAGAGSFQVGYGDGRHSASGFIATRPITYDKFCAMSFRAYLQNMQAVSDGK